MMRRWSTLGAAALLAIGLATAAEEKKVEEPVLNAGDAAPAFSLPGSDGETYQLEQFKGKKAVVIAWFPKAFTGG
jgi:peroxiredoxin Q/BCP